MTATASISAGPLADEVVYPGERVHGQVMGILITNGNDHQWSSRRRKRKTKKKRGVSPSRNSKYSSNYLGGAFLMGTLIHQRYL